MDYCVLLTTAPASNIPRPASFLTSPHPAPSPAPTTSRPLPPQLVLCLSPLFLLLCTERSSGARVPAPWSQISPWTTAGVDKQRAARPAGLHRPGRVVAEKAGLSIWPHLPRNEQLAVRLPTTRQATRPRSMREGTVSIAKASWGPPQARGFTAHQPLPATAPHHSLVGTWCAPQKRTHERSRLSRLPLLEPHIECSERAASNTTCSIL